jgi:hypothetical protein
MAVLMKDSSMLMSSPVVFKEGKEPLWFIVKQNEDSDWELPKTIARKGESSVRASIRAMAEQGGMRANVIEEVGRSGGAAKINGRNVSQRYLFYLMVYREGTEILGYADSDWLPFSKAVRKLTQKRDQSMLREANSMLKNIEVAEDVGN